MLSTSRCVVVFVVYDIDVDIDIAIAVGRYSYIPIAIEFDSYMGPFHFELYLY